MTSHVIASSFDVENVYYKLGLRWNDFQVSWAYLNVTISKFCHFSCLQLFIDYSLITPEMNNYNLLATCLIAAIKLNKFCKYF